MKKRNVKVVGERIGGSYAMWMQKGTPPRCFVKKTARVEGGERLYVALDGILCVGRLRAEECGQGARGGCLLLGSLTSAPPDGYCGDISK
jgi:hypothetical protein